MRSLSVFILTIFTLLGCDAQDTHVALGTLERDRVVHTATVAEVVVELPVAAGTQVTAGQLLVRLDDRQQQAQVAHARAQVAQAKAELDKLRNGARVEEVAAARANVAGARAALEESRSNYRRTQKLVAQGMDSKAALDRVVSNRDRAVASLQSAEEALRVLTNGTREEDLQRGEAILQAAEASLASEQKMLEDLSITATRDGVLDNLPWNLGERVTQGSPLAIILAGKAPHARVYVPEPYRVNIHVGDTLSVAVDGVPDSIAGQVRWIATEPAFTPYYALNQEERARLMYLAEVQLPDSAADLPSGVPAQVLLP